MGLNLALSAERRLKIEHKNKLTISRERKCRNCLRLTDQRKLESFFLVRKADFLASDRRIVGREINL
jgi:hypothetical protein